MDRWGQLQLECDFWKEQEWEHVEEGWTEEQRDDRTIRDINERLRAREEEDIS